MAQGEQFQEVERARVELLRQRLAEVEALTERVQALEAGVICEALLARDGNVVRAAIDLGVTRSWLVNAIKRRHSSLKVHVSTQVGRPRIKVG